jgi:hypothetical protein
MIMCLGFFALVAAGFSWLKVGSHEPCISGTVLASDEHIHNVTTAVGVACNKQRWEFSLAGSTRSWHNTQQMAPESFGG